MNKRNQINYTITATLFIAFITLTFMIKNIDIKPIGPEGTSIGLSSINHFVFNYLGVTLLWYYLTDWLGLVSIMFACAFGVLGLAQLIKRKSLKNVDADILLLGLFYLAIIGCYIMFEKIIINYRPILMDGELEASYPSSHTMIVVSIMTMSMIQFHHRIKRKKFIRLIDIFSILIIVVTIIGRLLSGVHWLTDIIGGVLLSATLNMLYYSIIYTCNQV
ncbi:phosphatase PAP2 family protein [Sediminispirochaeta bajacaliforniensis]|uniref:phosphatase PAP2 family protein n=1 Tax=Sediminispirochaeta bajacaliforniensis TaxID=148 RepID=UPI00035E57B1|nr:phosphatase PAP2 family protein [Sediminispirochaeta bajacaliforniensis]